MNSSPHDPVGKLFKEARRLAEVARAEFLAGVEKADPVQAAELRQLLAHDDQIAAGHGLLKRPLLPDSPATLQPTISKLLPRAAEKDATLVLLHRRLLYAGLFGFFSNGGFLVKDLLADLYSVAPWWLFVAHVVCVVIFFFLCLWLLANRRRLHERSLRVAEALGLFGIVLFFAAYHIYRFDLCLPYLAQHTPLEGDFVDASNEALCFRWFALIVSYGIFIPNPRRRFWPVIGGLMVLPLLLTAVVILRTVAFGVVWELFFDMACWSCLAVFLAVAGAIIIHRLGQQVEEARQIGAYLLEDRPLGAGGMGIVFRATHRQLLQPCAVKLIHPERIGDAASRERFFQEARTMAQLSHPHIVQVYNCDEHEGVLFLVMEYLSGLNLQQLVVKSGRLPPGRAVHLLRQACSALAYLHRIGFVHNDVKPSNLFSCEYGGTPDFVKLLDFGITGQPAGKSEGLLNPAGQTLGTPGYTAPERLGNPKAPSDPRSDIFSLGATAYYLLTGQGPFQRGSVLETWSAVLRGDWLPLAEQLPSDTVDLAAVVTRCLAREPGNRYQEVTELKAALEHCLCAAAYTATPYKS
jgi:Protein kinase domain